MTTSEVTNQLQGIATSDDFQEKSAELTKSWSDAGAGIEVLEPILRFIEEHPSIEFGMPGAIVHFMERFYGKGYDERLIESVERKPTTHTVWMLNRVINGTKSPEMKRMLVEVMRHAVLNPASDPGTSQLASRFLARLPW